MQGTKLPEKASDMSDERQERSVTSEAMSIGCSDGHSHAEDRTPARKPPQGCEGLRAKAEPVETSDYGPSCCPEGRGFRRGCPWTREPPREAHLHGGGQGPQRLGEDQAQSQPQLAF